MGGAAKGIGQSHACGRVGIKGPRPSDPTSRSDSDLIVTGARCLLTGGIAQGRKLGSNRN